LPKEAYTPWFTRAAALVIDYIPILILSVIRVVYFVSSVSRDVTACLTDLSDVRRGRMRSQQKPESTVVCGEPAEHCCVLSRI